MTNAGNTSSDIAGIPLRCFTMFASSLTMFPNIDSSPIYLGRTVDLFASLVLAGHIPKWDGTFEEAD